MRDEYLQGYKDRFTSELIQLWEFYKPKFVELIYDQFKSDYDERWKKQVDEQRAAINIQNEVIRELESRIETLELYGRSHNDTPKS